MEIRYVSSIGYIYSSIGYILEVVLEYPEELNDLHNNYPLAPEKIAIPYDMLSDHCKNCRWIWNKSWWCKKLIPNLGDKTNYVLHYRNLHLHLSFGMKLMKIHKVLKFKQSYWMKIYVDFLLWKKNSNQWKRFFKILQQTNVYFTKNIW